MTGTSVPLILPKERESGESVLLLIYSDLWVVDIIPQRGKVKTDRLLEYGGMVNLSPMIAPANSTIQQGMGSDPFAST